MWKWMVKLIESGVTQIWKFNDDKYKEHLHVWDMPNVCFFMKMVMVLKIKYKYPDLCKGLI